ncbi:HK97 family phage prohead protease [Litorimonas sp. RW-G-Af-16]|uniref:HK97 family phage prohead protease n=1 Tax=Litorimonas sp. RW-G-Af-16 TaxID=3241168 RepID=UPI00390CBB9D
MEMSSPADLRVSGYASLFGQPDLSGDQVQRGAFAASLLKLPDGRLPMLFGHETDQPIGVWDRLLEDRSGLFVSGRVFSGSARSERVRRWIAEGAVSGLSIGYRVRRKSQTSQGRLLLDLDLWEVSVVAFPMLRSARITQIDDVISQNPTSQRSLIRES